MIKFFESDLPIEFQEEPDLRVVRGLVDSRLETHFIVAYGNNVLHYLQGQAKEYIEDIFRNYRLFLKMTSGFHKRYE